ncbi:MAG: ribonuclease J [Candidatus Pacebacteria bacterium]|jgi:ribonuclease J|nr:ribonuclease J [Candidatus Paceibacterota bacterium]
MNILRKNNPGFSALREASTGPKDGAQKEITAHKQGGGQGRNRRGGQKSRTFQYQKFGGKRPNRRPPTPQNKDSQNSTTPQKNRVRIPDPEPGVLRVIPLGGCEQVGQNMTALEYGTDIIVVDVGMQFATPDTPGIDYIVPNTKYLEERKDRIRGIFITHGHLDHVGAIPAVISAIGNPPIYSREFGAAIILKRQEEFPHLPKLNMNIVGANDTVQAGEAFTIKTFAISHTIPDSMGLFITTPLGDVALIEDVRVDNIAGIPTEEEALQYERFHEKKILFLTMDSTSIEKPGWSLSENTVISNIEKIIAETPGRMIIATFASQVERLVAIIEIAERFGRKIVIEGRSMKANIEISKQLGILKSKNLIAVEEMASYPPNKILMIVTGAQGEEFAALMRMANKTHRQVQLSRTDTILLSSSIVPGNESAVDKLKDNLYRSDARIITYRDSDIHASGHGNREELAWIHRQFNYKYFMPLHGNHYMLKQHAELARMLGAAPENIIVPDNGSIIEIYDGGEKIRVRKEKAPAELVMVDGFAVGNEQEVVVRDRQILAKDGMFVVIATVDSQTGKLRKSPDIISRGFVYLKEAQELLKQVRGIVKKTIEEDARGQHPIDFDFIKSDLGDAIAKFLYQNTAKRPLVIPVILSV